MWSSLSSWSSGPRLTEARWSGRVGSSLGSPGPSWNQRSVRSWMLISTRPPAGGSTSVTGTVRRRCRPRSGRCGSRSRGIGRVRSRRGSSRSTAAGWMGSRRRSASLYAKGPTTGEISAQLADVYDADVSRELISRVTDSVVDEMRLRTAACPTPDHLIRSLGRTVRLGLDTPTTAGLGAACCCVGPSSAAPGAGCCHGGLLGREPEAGKLRSLRNAVQDQGRVHAGGSNLRVDEPSAEVVNGLHDDLVPYLAPVEPKGIPSRMSADSGHPVTTTPTRGTTKESTVSIRVTGTHSTKLVPALLNSRPLSAGVDYCG